MVKREAAAAAAGDSDRQINEPGAIIILPPYRISSVSCISFLSSHWRLLFPCRPQEPAVTLPPPKCAFVGTVFYLWPPLLLFLHGQMTTYACRIAFRFPYKNDELIKKTSPSDRFDEPCEGGKNEVKYIGISPPLLTPELKRTSPCHAKANFFFSPFSTPTPPPGAEKREREEEKRVFMRC